MFPFVPCEFFYSGVGVVGVLVFDGGCAMGIVITGLSKVDLVK